MRISIVSDTNDLNLSVVKLFYKLRQRYSYFPKDNMFVSIADYLTRSAVPKVIIMVGKSAA